MANHELEVEIVFKPPLDPGVEIGLLDDANRELETTMMAATQLLHGAVLPRTPHAFGNLRGSLQPDTTVIGDLIIGRVTSNLPYAQWVELGSEPHWVPIDPLKLWAKRKLGDESLAYAVQRAIARRGTKGHFMFREGFKEVRGQVYKLFEIAIDKIMTRWRAQ